MGRFSEDWTYDHIQNSSVMIHETIYNIPSKKILMVSTRNCNFKRWVGTHYLIDLLQYHVKHIELHTHFIMICFGMNPESMIKIEE